MDTKTKEAIRVVGYLLETNSTYATYARTKSDNVVRLDSPQACKFCLAGATYLVDRNIYQPKCGKLLPTDLYGKVASYLAAPSLVGFWDSSSKEARREIVQKLKNA